MKEVWNKNKKTIIVITLIAFVILAIIVIANNNTIKTSNYADKKGYIVIKHTIIGNEKIYRVVCNTKLTEDKMKEIYDEYDEDNKKIRIWFFDNKINAENLESYNVAEITKENGEFEIHRYEEEKNAIENNLKNNDISISTEGTKEENKNISTNNTNITSSNNSSTSKKNEDSNSNNKINVNKSTTSVTTGKRNALARAKSYLNYMAFSYKGLVEQLEYEGYSNEEATYAVDNCGANWNEQAAKKAESYMSYMSFSRSGLIEQLEYEGFTSKQAEYGVTAVGY